MRVSIAIPTYEMHGKGAEMLKRCLDSIRSQTFKDYEIVISDNSKDDEIQKLCENYTVEYFRNSNIGMATNTNFAIEMSIGNLVKILYQDDYFAHETALQTIIDNFNDSDNWLITACSNNPNPRYSDKNTLGSPSVLTIKGDNLVKFDDSLKWALDLDFYKRMKEMYGEPKIIPDINIIMGIGEHQATNHLSEEIKNAEDTRITSDNR